MILKVKKLNENAKLPTRGSSSAAGWDLYALEDAKIPRGQTYKISTGLSIEIPEGYFGAIYARSGLATKSGLRPANCVGVIDSDYRGPVIVALHNDNLLHEVHSDENGVHMIANMNDAKIVEAGERIAQLVIQKYEEIEIEEVDELDDTDRGEGGFGSTGTN